jgi:glycine/sarcosine N-methyltransferase
MADGPSTMPMSEPAVSTPLYDELSQDYDRFVNWGERLAYEVPFIERWLASVAARRVLDAACGTGRHAIALAARGFEPVGADLSAPMIRQARGNAAAAGAEVPFFVAGFGHLAPLPGAPFDALLCLGNSLPHVLTLADLEHTLADFAAALRPGGSLLIQNRNLDAVVAARDRWMGPEAYREPGREWLFVRFYDFNPDGTLTFNMVRLRREDGGPWQQQVDSTPLYPWSSADLAASLGAAGFGDLRLYGDMAGAPFDPAASGNLIITAIRHEQPGPEEV